MTRTSKTALATIPKPAARTLARSIRAMNQPATALGFHRDDGGRSAAGYQGTAGDCVTRAIAIATGLDYQDVYDALNSLARLERRGKRKRGTSSARTGVHRVTYERFLRSIGWRWTPTMGIGTGCRVHMRRDELPTGTLVVSLSRHLAAVVDGTVYDTHDPSRDGTRCVYGYWQPPEQVITPAGQ